MTDRVEPTAAFREALEVESWERVEELWLESLEEAPVPTAQLLEVRRLLWKAGKKGLGRTLLELLVETLEDGSDHRATVAALRELVRLTDKPDAELKERLEQAVAAARAGSPSLRPVLGRYDIRSSRHPIDALDAVERWLDHDVGTIVEVLGQGVGRVTDLNLELDSIKVDIGARRPVTVLFGAIPRYVRSLPDGDFLRRKVEQPELLAARVAEEPGEALAELLSSLGEASDVAAVKTALDGLLPASSWTGWWNKARKHPRIITTGSGSRLRYSISGSAESATNVLLEELQTAQPRQRLVVAKRVADRGAEAAAAATATLAEQLSELESAEPGLAWETAAVLADLPGGAAAAAAGRDRLIASTPHLQLLSGIEDRAARSEALAALRAADDGEWTEQWAEWLLHEQHPAILDTVAGELDGAGQADALDASLEAVFRNHNEHPAQFVWACERMTDEDCPDVLRRRMSPSLLEKLTDTLDKPEFGPYRGRAKSLLDGGRVAIRLLLETTSPELTSRFVNRVGRISTVEPQRQKLLEQAARQSRGAEATPAPTLFVASRKAVEAKQAELKQLLEVEIPKTLKGIQAAAAEGDLRENFEYHMLRDRQELQSARAAKIQRELGEVRILEPGAADTSRVNIGTVVHLEDPDGDRVEPVAILGTWDADPERRVFANGSGVAARLLDCGVGDQVEVDGVTARIVEITAWQG